MNSVARVLIFGSLFFLLQYPIKADAADRKVKKALSDLQKVKKAEAELKKDITKLNPNQQTTLLAMSIRQGANDDDSDGVPNAIEHALGTDVCSNDTNGDGESDANEREAKGKLAAVGDGTFDLRDAHWTFDNNVIFENGNTSNMIIGACVEAHGSVDTTTQIISAHKIEFKSSSSCR